LEIAGIDEGQLVQPHQGEGLPERGLGIGRDPVGCLPVLADPREGVRDLVRRPG
jgi:hypothetical protein